MNRRLTLALCTGAFLATASTAIADPDAQSFSRIERGRYLTTVGDCVACHTAPGGKPFAGGLKIETPFGTMVSPNITPDAETGIGAWTDAEFTRAMREGVGRDGSQLYPAFPYTSFTKATPEDTLAIRAYLATLEPVRNPVVSNTLPFPFNIRSVMLIWNKLYFSPGVFQPDPRQTAQWSRGAYLAQGLGHCDTCHTPRGRLGGEISDQAFRGAVIQDWLAPSLANDRTGLANWSNDDVVQYLRTGHNKNAAATGPMSDVIHYSTSKMTDDDLTAMAVYLKTLHGADASTSSISLSDAQMKDGAAIYQSTCAACHQMSGEGVPGLFPALAKAPGAQSANPTNLIRVLLRGARSVATDAAPTAPAMPAYGWKLNDVQIAAVATYVRNSWTNIAPAVSASSVAASRSALARRVD